MKVLLANPPCRIDIGEGKERFFIRAGSRWPFSTIKNKNQKIDYVPFPFYLAYTAALLERSGHDVFVIDAIPLNMSNKEFIEKTVKINPNVILFETSTPTFYYDTKLINELKSLGDFIIVLAGPHVSTFPKESLIKCKNIDYVLIREYELNFSNLIDLLSKGKKIDKIKGIAFMNKNKIFVNDTDLTNLSKLPIPARHLFPCNDLNDMTLYWDGFCQSKPAIQMHATRGCPFRCNFCLWNQVMYNNGRYRTFSIERVFDEIEELINQYNAKEIYFDDDTFTGSKKFVMEFCKEMKRRRLDIKWSIMGDAMITDKEMINAMADAGCIGMKFGIESGNHDILKRIGKPVDFGKVKSVASLCAKKGIKTHATFTFGLSGETRDTMEQTMRFACELDVDSVQFSITTPFPGTKYYEEAQRNGLLLTKNWSDYDGASNSVVRFENLSTKEVSDFCRKASGRWLRYKLKSPQWVWRQVRNINKLRINQGNTIIYQKLKRMIELMVES